MIRVETTVAELDRVVPAEPANRLVHLPYGRSRSERAQATTAAFRPGGRRADAGRGLLRRGP